MVNSLIKSSSFPRIPSFNAPSLFQDDIFEKFFKSFEDDSYYYHKKTIPYNVYNNEDDEGNLVSQDLEFAVAGFRKEDISIKVKDGYLEVYGNHNNVDDLEDASKDKPRVKRKLAYGGMSNKSFSYRFGGVQGVSPENVTAELKDGMLYVHVDRSQTIDNSVDIKIT